MICAIIWTWRLKPLLPFIMVKSHIIIWMTISNNRVLRCEDWWIYQRGSFSQRWIVGSEGRSLVWDMFVHEGSARLDVFFFYSSSLLLHKHFKNTEVRMGIIFEIFSNTGSFFFQQNSAPKHHQQTSKLESVATKDKNLILELEPLSRQFRLFHI